MTVWKLYVRSRRIHLIDFCVDAIQGLGVFPIDVRSMHIDYLSANSHKWLVSPPGASIFFIDRAKLEKIRPNSVGWKSVADPHSYSSLDYRLKEDSPALQVGFKPFDFSRAGVYGDENWVKLATGAAAGLMRSRSWSGLPIPSVLK